MKFKPYPNYKDSGIEWLGEIPKGWDIKKLKYLAKIKNGQDQKQVLIEEGGFPVYGSGGEFGRAYQYLYNQKSVLLGRKGTIDKPLFIQEPFWTVDTMYYTKIFSSVFPKFFFYQCLTIEFNYYQFGSTVPSMTQESLHNNYFAVPNFQDQATIANFLDRETLRIDALVEEKNHFIGLLKEKRQTLISHVVTKGLDPTVKMKDSGIDWLGEIPEHWEIGALRRHLVKRLANGVFKTKDEFGKGTLLVNVFDIYRKDFRIEYSGLDRVECTKKEQDTYDVKENDIFFVRSSLKYEGIAAVAIAEAINAPVVFECHLIRARPNATSLQGRFASYLFNSALYRAKLISSSKITTMTTIDQETILAIKICLPSFTEQTAIANFLDNQTTKIDALITETQQSIALLKEHRTALISAAVTGKIDVREVA